MKKIGIIIQARVGSKRLNKKVINKLDDKLLIEWVIKRLKKTKIRNIILATGDLKQNQILEKICKNEGIKFYKGSEANVLERFYKASIKFKLDAIIRVCADNPFVDSKEIGILVDAYKQTNFINDYYFNHKNYQNKTYADGFGAELIKFSTLKDIYEKANSSFDKEHVTSFIWKKKDKYKIFPCKTKVNKNFHHIVCDINNVDDYTNIQEFILKKKILIKDDANKIAKLFSLFEIRIYLNKLFNLNRSLAGSENRKTLNYIKKKTPIKIKSFTSGKKVFDWKIPYEWAIKKAYIKDNKGNDLVNIKNNFLHVASYSQSVKKIMKFEELSKKIFTCKVENAIPYRTLYYKKDWAFCLSKKDLRKFKFYSKNELFKVLIDSNFKKGEMNYGEILIPGKSKKEILISTYICHPSMANDNLSGIILTVLLSRYINNLPNLKWSYRIIFIPETIGAISYIKYNKKIIKNIDFGLNISCVGGKGPLSYKETWNKNHFLNSLIKKIFLKNNLIHKKYKYDIHGSDERQYSYPGNEINMLSIHKDKYYEYKEYHTSLDNLNFVNEFQIFKSFTIHKQMIQEIENQEIYISKNNMSEPMLSKHNLYPKVGGSLMTEKNKNISLNNILWILFLCNGQRTLNQIKNKLKIEDKVFFEIIRKLKNKSLIYHV